MTDLSAQIRQALAELELVSHAPTSGYGRDAHDTSDSKGGRRPPGADYEFRPRRPSSPLREGDAASEKAWREFEEELQAWEACYHRRTVDHYRRLLRSRGPSDGLLADVRGTVQAWKRQPAPAYGIDPERESFYWRCTVADDPRDSKSVQKFYGVSRSTVKRYRASYKGVMRTIWTSDG